MKRLLLVLSLSLPLHAQVIGGGGGSGGSGTGTVTVVGAGTLSNGVVVTGGGTTLTQTPSVNPTIDGSGNMSSGAAGTPTITFAGGLVGGTSFLAQGSPSVPGNPSTGQIACYFDPLNANAMICKNSAGATVSTTVSPSTGVGNNFLTNIDQTGVQHLATIYGQYLNRYVSDGSNFTSITAAMNQCVLDNLGQGCEIYAPNTAEPALAALPNGMSNAGGETFFNLHLGPITWTLNPAVANTFFTVPVPNNSSINGLNGVLTVVKPGANWGGFQCSVTASSYSGTTITYTLTGCNQAFKEDMVVDIQGLSPAGLNFAPPNFCFVLGSPAPSITSISCYSPTNPGAYTSGGTNAVTVHPVMFQVGDTPSANFTARSRLEHLTINCNGVANSIAWVMRNSQEESWVKHVDVLNCATTGLMVSPNVQNGQIEDIYEHGCDPAHTSTDASPSACPIHPGGLPAGLVFINTGDFRTYKGSTLDVIHTYTTPTITSASCAAGIVTITFTAGQGTFDSQHLAVGNAVYWSPGSNSNYQGSYLIASVTPATPAVTLTVPNGVSGAGTCPGGGTPTGGTLQVLATYGDYIGSGSGTAASLLQGPNSTTQVPNVDLHMEHAKIGLEVQGSSTFMIAHSPRTAGTSDSYTGIHCASTVKICYIEDMEGGSSNGNLQDDSASNYPMPVQGTIGVYHGGTSSLSVFSDSITIGNVFQTLTDAATITWNVGNASFGNASLTFTVGGGSRTLNVTNLMPGGAYTLWVKQFSSGVLEGLTLGTGCVWKISGGGGGAITPTTGANAIDVLRFNYDGTNCYAVFTKNYT